MTVTVHMSEDQYGQLVAQAVRYALGRRTYVVEDTIRAVRAGWEQIPPAMAADHRGRRDAGGHALLPGRGAERLRGHVGQPRRLDARA
jgi:hypothetical protein